MWFTNKKGILEHCGKNEKDVRWLDRAIKKGIVLHNLELGYITTLDYVKELEERGEKKSEVVVSTNSKEVEELKEHLKYAWGRYEMAKKSIMHVINSFSKGDAKKEEEMKRKVGYKDDDREESERQWASENGII